MSTGEQAQGQSPRRLLRGSWLDIGGEPNPVFCWPKPMWRAFAEKVQPECDPATGLLVVASNEDIATYYAFDATGRKLDHPTTVASSLELATNGIGRLSDEHRAAFIEPYEGLVSNPGMQGVDVVVMTIDLHDIGRNALTHFGPREIPELAPQLGALAAKVSAQPALA